MNSRLFFLCIPLCVSFALTTAACGGGGGSSEEAVSEGKGYVEARKCADCHKADFAGDTEPRAGTMEYPANLTPDMATGIGGWTDDQIKKAIRQGVDDEGETLCSEMPRFGDMNDEEATAIVAYLRSLKAVSKEIPESTCAAQ